MKDYVVAALGGVVLGGLAWFGHNATTAGDLAEAWWIPLIAIAVAVVAARSSRTRVAAKWVALIAVAWLGLAIGFYTMFYFLLACCVGY